MRRDELVRSSHRIPPGIVAALGILAALDGCKAYSDDPNAEENLVFVSKSVPCRDGKVIERFLDKPLSLDLVYVRHPLSDAKARYSFVLASTWLADGPSWNSTCDTVIVQNQGQIFDVGSFPSRLSD